MKGDKNINKVLKLVADAKQLEKSRQYERAGESYQSAADIFKNIREKKLQAKCQVAHAVNMTKYYLEERDIEHFSGNTIEIYIKEINGIMALKFNIFEKYDILISAYRELEKVFADRHMVEDENAMYYKRTSLYHKFYWQRAMQKGRKCREKIRDIFSFFINLCLHKFCGHGEKPLNALLLITFIILIFSVLYKWLNLIEFVDAGKTLCFWQSLYFSVITFTTLGYGDIIPSDTSGQILVVIEVTLGVLFLGLLLATLTRKFTK